MSISQVSRVQPASSPTNPATASEVKSIAPGEAGISCGVINARWLKPMDPRLASEWAVRYPLLLAAEDNLRAGGFGAAVLETLAEHGLAGKVRLAGLGDRFLPHGKPAAILADSGLDPDGLAASVRAALAQVRV